MIPTSRRCPARAMPYDTIRGMNSSQKRLMVTSMLHHKCQTMENSRFANLPSIIGSDHCASSGHYTTYEFGLAQFDGWDWGTWKVFTVQKIWRDKTPITQWSKELCPPAHDTCISTQFCIWIWFVSFATPTTCAAAPAHCHRDGKPRVAARQGPIPYLA